MQPENSQQLGVPEQLPMPPAISGERIPVLPSVETGIERGAERREQAAEASAAVADAISGGVPMATPIAPVILDPVAPVSDSPLVAADEDLIEKEWVDKAREIIAQTKDDPHARTLRVNQLQKDYLQKRYNKVIGASE